MKEAIFSIDRDKFLGPSGFPMFFYQECWDIVNKDLMKVFTEFYERGTIRWIGWIMYCLDYPHFSVMINGTSKGFFSSSRGLRH